MGEQKRYFTQLAGEYFTEENCSEGDSSQVFLLVMLSPLILLFQGGKVSWLE